MDQRIASSRKSEPLENPNEIELIKVRQQKAGLLFKVLIEVDDVCLKKVDFRRRIRICSLIRSWCACDACRCLRVMMLWSGCQARTVEWLSSVRNANSN